MDTARVLLIVLADPAHRALFTRYLSGTPHHLVFCPDGEEAYDRFHEVKPDFVVAHLRAPRLDGALLCQLVRQRLGGVKVPFVLVGETELETEGRRRAGEVDADLFIALPISEQRFRIQLDPLLTEGRGQSSEQQEELPPAVESEGDTAAMEPHEVFAVALGESPDTGLSFTQSADTDSTSFETTTDTHNRLALAERLPAETNDIDTVVSYENPFYEGLEEVAASDGDESVTHVAIERPSLEPIVVRPPEPGIATPDPLEEPPINVVAGRLPSEDSGFKSNLIAEVPRERTPTGDSDEAVVVTEGIRRGLDESQLGKRLAKRVRSMYRLLEEADAHQLLGVPSGADYDRIRKAYYELSLEFHPDRFFLLRSGDLKEKIYAIYRRVGEAFQELCDHAISREETTTSSAVQTVTQSRTPTPGPLEREDSDSVTTSPRTIAPPRADTEDELVVSAETETGQRYVALAQTAFAEGDFNHARLMLLLARSRERDNSSLREALNTVVRATEPTI